MRFIFVSAILSTLTLPVLSLPSPSHSNHVVHEKRDTIQRKWQSSDPRSPRYGKHYTFDEVTDLFAPSALSVNAVKAWLVESGIREERISQSTNKAWLQFDASTAEMEQLLQTTYHYYKHVNGGRKHIGCEDYKIPAAITDHIDYVTPGVKLLATRGMGDIKKRDLASPARRPMRKQFPADVLAEIKKNPEATTTCGTAITPACIRAMYNITLGKTSHSGNKLGIFEFTDFYAQEDLNQFFHTYFPKIHNGTKPTAAFVDGATAPVSQENAGGESELDFEIAYPIIHPQGTVLYQTDGTQWDFFNRPGIFNTWLDAIDGSYCTYSSNNETGDDPNVDPVYPAGKHHCGKYKPANVISLSYGLVEADFPTNYQIRQCNEFLKLGLPGVTIDIASGDAGVSDRNGVCLGPNRDIFSPDYPDCPYVTMVGATTLPSGSNPGDPETATTSFSSGGGFSNIYAQPSYQKNAVESSVAI